MQFEHKLNKMTVKGRRFIWTVRGQVLVQVCGFHTSGEEKCVQRSPSSQHPVLFNSISTPKASIQPTHPSYK